MIRFVIARLGQGLLVAWLAISLLFALFFLAPGDRVDQVVGGERILSEEQRGEVAERLGLNEPVAEQYKRYLVSIAQADLGESFVQRRPVSEILADAVPASLRLAFWALVVELLVGVGLALAFYLRPKRATHAVSVVATTALVAAPIFVVAISLQLIFGVLPFRLGLDDQWRIPVQGLGPDAWVLGVFPVGDQWRYLLLPALCLGLASAAIAHRLTANGIQRAAQAPVVQAARLRGVKERHVLWRHVARPALPAVLTFIAVDAAALFGAAVVTETVFNWPGIGSEIATALSRADIPVLLGATIVLAVAYTVVNLVFDVVHRGIDPRVGAKS